MKKISVLAIVMVIVTFAMYGTWESSCKGSVSAEEALLNENVEALSRNPEGEHEYCQVAFNPVACWKEGHFMGMSWSSTVPQKNAGQVCVCVAGSRSCP